MRDTIHRPHGVALKPTPDDRARELSRMKYEDYLRTPEWTAIRDASLARDGYRCRGCDSPQALEVHHRKYVRPFERGSEIEELVTLCHPCHRAVHVVKDLRNDIQRVPPC